MTLSEKTYEMNFPRKENYDVIMAELPYIMAIFCSAAINNFHKFMAIYDYGHYGVPIPEGNPWAFFNINSDAKPCSLSRYCMLRGKRGKTFWIQFARPNSDIMDLRHQSSAMCIIMLGGEDTHPWSATKVGNPIPASTPEAKKTTSKLLLSSIISVK